MRVVKASEQQRFVGAWTWRGFGAPSSLPKWRAIQNKKVNPYTIEIACDFAR
jgi:hypothetical protein